jgi:hypothetical protein
MQLVERIRLDERPRPVDVFPALVGGDDHRIHLAQHVLGAPDDMGDTRSPRHPRPVGRVVAPHVSDLCAGNPQRRRWLRAEILRNGRVAAIGHRRGVVAAVDDRAPTERVAVAVDHPQHRQANPLRVGNQAHIGLSQQKQGIRPRGRRPPRLSPAPAGRVPAL